MVPRLSALFFSLLLGMSAAHAQQNPFSDFLKGLGGIFQGTPETRQDQRLAEQPSPSVQTSDAYHMERALGFALQVTSSGIQTTWQNPTTGHHGGIIPSETFNTSTGQVCRKFERTLVVGSGVTRYEGTACRQTSGAWTIRTETIVLATSVARTPTYSTPTGQPTPSSSQALTANAQELLTQLGHNPGPIDGIYGGKTRRAIEAFQRKEGLPEDGRVSEGLLASLRAVTRTTASPVSGPQEEARQELIDALEELDWAVSDKINHDVETTARAFADAYDIEQSRRIADFVLAPLTVIEQTIGLLALVKRPSEISTAMSHADGVLEVASLLMAAGELLAAGENLQLAIDGPTYSSLAEAMHKEAATSSDPGEYAATVQLNLFGIGNRKSPIWARHRVGNKTEMVWGARAVKRRISEAIALLSKEISATGVGSGTPAEEILATVGEITTAIKWSKARNVPVPLGGALATGISAATQTQIGSIGALEQVRNFALKNYDSDLHLKQIAVATNASKAGFEALLLTVGYETEAGQQLAEIHRTVVTPVSVAVGAVTKFYSTNARQEVNGLPYQMLLALPAELSNTWTLVDHTLSYIRNLVQPPKVAAGQDTQPGTQTTEQTPPSQQTSAPIQTTLATEQTSAATPACAVERSKHAPETKTSGDYERGLELFQQADYAGAYKVWLPLAKNGDARAQTMIGELYKNSWGVAFNVREAERWHLMAAEQDYPEGQYNLGNLYVEGWGIKDCNKGMAWLRKAANQGHSRAQLLLAYIYESGQNRQWMCVPRNVAQAYMWTTLAAATDDREIAQRAKGFLGQLEWYGMTPAQIAQAKEEARLLQQTIAQTQSAEAQGAPSPGQSDFYWAMTAYNSKDYATALQILEPLAKSGDSCAQHMLGFFYDKGRGVSANEAKAREWYQKAAAQGDTEAIQPLQSSDVSSVASNQMGTIVLKMIGVDEWVRGSGCNVYFQITNRTRHKFKDISINNLFAIDSDGDVIDSSLIGIRHYYLLNPNKSAKANITYDSVSCSDIAALALLKPKSKMQIGKKKCPQYFLQCRTIKKYLRGLQCGKLAIHPDTKKLNLFFNVEYAHQPKCPL